MYKFIMGIVVFSFASSVSAGWHTAKIEKISTYLNGGIYVYVDTVHECGSTQIGMDSSAAGFKNVYSALLSYEAQKKFVEFAIQSCDGTIAVIDRVVSKP